MALLFPAVAQSSKIDQREIAPTGKAGVVKAGPEDWTARLDEAATAAKDRLGLLGAITSSEPYFGLDGACRALSIQFAPALPGGKPTAVIYELGATTGALVLNWAGATWDNDTDLLAKAAQALNQRLALQVDLPASYLWLGQGQAWAVYDALDPDRRSPLACNLTSLAIATVAQLEQQFAAATPDASAAHRKPNIKPGVSDNPLAQAVVALFINGQNRRTPERDVDLTADIRATIESYQASESPDLAGAPWLEMRGQNIFTLSPGLGRKTVYFRGRAWQGVSDVVAASIELVDSREITLNAAAIKASIESKDEEDWYRFTLGKGTTLRIETIAGTLKASHLTLYGPGNAYTKINENAGDLDTAMGAVQQRLEPGTYYVKVNGIFDSLGSYGVRLTTQVVAPRILDFKINAGDATVGTPFTRLNYSSTGYPIEFLASESPVFSGATWQPVTPDPDFHVSPTLGMKTIYLKVRDAAGVQSAVAQDSIELKATRLAIDGTTTTVTVDFLTGNGVSANYNYTFTVETTGTYRIATQLAGVTETHISLYDAVSYITSSAHMPYGAGVIETVLKPGIYFASVGAIVFSPPGSFNLRVTNTSGPLLIGGIRPFFSYPQDDHLVYLGFSMSGNPQYFQISERADFAGAPWLRVSNIRYGWEPYRFAPGYGTRTLYMRLKDAKGNLSPVAQQIVVLDDSAPVIENFQIISTYGYLDHPQAVLYAFPHGFPTHYMASESPSFVGAYWKSYTYDMTMPFEFSAAPGQKTVYFKLKNAAGNESAVVSASITLVDPAPPTIAYFDVVGAANTKRTSEHTVSWYANSNDPAVGIKLSESPNFSGAQWQPYANSGTFVLAAGNGMKTVYCQMRNWQGEESAVLKVQISMEQQLVGVKVNQEAVTGNIEWAGESDWYQFTVPSTGTYRIQTWAGTLAGTVLTLYGPGNQTTVIKTASGYFTPDSLAGMEQVLAPGTYYVRVQPYRWDNWPLGSYSLRITTQEAIKPALK